MSAMHNLRISVVYMYGWIRPAAASCRVWRVVLKFMKVNGTYI